jgi:hypothetical protein
MNAPDSGCRGASFTDANANAVDSNDAERGKVATWPSSTVATPQSDGSLYSSGNGS